MGENRCPGEVGGQHVAHRPHPACQLRGQDIELPGVDLGQLPGAGRLMRQPVDEVRRQLPGAGVQLGQQSPHAPGGLLQAPSGGLPVGVVRVEVSQVRVSAPLLHTETALALGHGLRIEQTGDREEPGQGAVDVVGRSPVAGSQPQDRGAVPEDQAP